MSKKVFGEIIAGLREAIDYVDGHRVEGFRVWETPPGATRSARRGDPYRTVASRPEYSDGVSRKSRKALTT